MESSVGMVEADPAPGPSSGTPQDDMTGRPGAIFMGMTVAPRLSPSPFGKLRADSALSRQGREGWRLHLAFGGDWGLDVVDGELDLLEEAVLDAGRETPVHGQLEGVGALLDEV